ncbi:hypothetical protein GCM10011509_19380 [Ornithinimicrobium pekingense]|uniref:Uncharacterized protein n=1 Tax=Ornithinimicrobium pekingense TaxID=384677 RepID=A0ABQ2FBD0_9MICO|nr:hypothetical protein GCM10011509_19380 [Ornithinimicrobium pekingense]
MSRPGGSVTGLWRDQSVVLHAASGPVAEASPQRLTSVRRPPRRLRKNITGPPACGRAPYKRDPGDRAPLLGATCGPVCRGVDVTRITPWEDSGRASGPRVTREKAVAGRAARSGPSPHLRTWPASDASSEAKSASTTPASHPARHAAWLAAQTRA